MEHQTTPVIDLTEILNAVKLLGDKLEGYQKSNNEKLLSLRKDIDNISQSRNLRSFTDQENTKKSPSAEINKPR